MNDKLNQLKNLTYKFTAEERTILEQAEFIKFKVFVHEVGNILGLKLSVEDATGAIIIDSDGVQRVVSETEFSAYLMTLAGQRQEDISNFSDQVINLVETMSVEEALTTDNNDDDDEYRLC